MKYYDNVIYLYISEVFLHVRSPRWAPLWLRLPRGPAAGCPASRPVVGFRRRATNPYWSKEALPELLYRERESVTIIKRKQRI